jgi:catechol 2,3-dioxygenase-like lactoylglutathione lyase family enzyme
MNIKFSSSVILVKNIVTSREFYEELLGQTVMMDNGPNVIYEGGFSIWQRDAALGIIFEDTPKSNIENALPAFELYFESSSLEQAWKRCSINPERVIHPIMEHPWGQQGFRIYDPDGFIIEVSEPLPVMVQRFIKEGYSMAQIAEKSGMPESLVCFMAEQSD